ncbi:MAG: cytochrome d ubiquinol oxidase subunit II [Acidimicrobiales bacterium]|nr:cytochrome d ubiquinol oxidase subunit II [Acidimicrobiales bacterium]MYD82103.1 cytochrome d ubiquinol oxidase subunit II [Acidimicrobiales bacterium]MYJ47226.1 cytochrome d ubiquinol oxidase subunit II [Acidimicrobiales bacterium]MYJ66872.1 cytochrome d ubiquinol oxidase subunit II [Acidimicrobiales bacterium]
MTLLRRHLPHVGLGLFLCVLAARAHSIFDGDSGALDYYLDDRLGDVNNLLTSLLVPILAGFLTWEIGKLRKSDALRADATKSCWRNIAHAAAPTVMVAFAVFALVQAWHVSRVPTTARGLLALMLPHLVLVSVLAFWSAIAARTPPILAVPLSIIVTWLAIAYPPSGLDWVWPRHMTGTLSGCCSAHEALAVEAMGATLLLAAALVIIAVALSSKRAVLWLFAAVLPVIGLLILGIRIVERLGWDSVVPRPSSELVCEQHGETQVCFWPEHEELFEAVGAEAAVIRERLTGFGIEIPTTFTEAPHAAEWAYNKRIDRNAVPVRSSEHTWTRQLHPRVLEVSGALRAQLTRAVIPRPICRSRHIPPHDERRSTEKLAPLAQAVVWHIVAGDMTGQSTLTEKQRQDVEYIVAVPDRASRFVEASVEAILGCDSVDVDNLPALAD